MGFKTNRYISCLDTLQRKNSAISEQWKYLEYIFDDGYKKLNADIIVIV